MQTHLGNRKGEITSLAGIQGFGKTPVSKAMGACEEKEENKEVLTRPGGCGHKHYQQQHVCLSRFALTEIQRRMKGTPTGNCVVWKEEVALLNGLQ